MGMYIDDKRLLIITELKTVHLDLPIDINNILKHEFQFILKDDKFLAEHRIKNKISQLLSKCQYGNNIHEQE